MNTIRKQWDIFNTTVIPADAPAIQRKEMRRAFYAGAEALLRINFEIGGENVSEDQGMTILNGLNEECFDFAKQVAAGKA